MNPFDMLIVVLLVYFVFAGVIRGGIREIASITALLGGFYVSYLWYEPFSGVFSVFITTESIRKITAFIVLFGIVVVCVTLAGTLLRAFLKLVLLGAVDRLSGAVIGGIKAVVVVAVLHFLALTFLPGGGAEIVARSRLAPGINKTAGAVAYIVPEKVKQEMAARARLLRREWDAGEAEAENGPGED